MKKLKLIIAGLATLAMTACAPAGGNVTSESTGETVDNYKVKVIAPKGAPSLAFYDMADDDDFHTAPGDKISGEFAQKNYGMIVMEFYTGLRNIKKTNSNYRLARILTGGNLYLVSRSGKTTAPTAEDKVIAFGPGGYEGIPYLSLTTLYPQIKKENVELVKDGSAVGGALSTGTYEGKKGDQSYTVPVDYVVIPQPALAVAMKSFANSEVKPSIVSCLRDKANEVSNGEQKWVLQAGLFIHEGLYQQHKAAFDAKLDVIDENINMILTNPEVVKNTIEAKLPNPEDAKAKFACPTAMIPNISKNQKTPNGFGFITGEEWENIDVQGFLTFLGRTGEANNFSNYFLTR